MTLPRFAFRTFLSLAFAVGVCLILLTTQVLKAGAATLAFNLSPKIDLSLNGWGNYGRVSASPTSVNFGNVQAGSSGSELETLTNTGRSTLTITSASTNSSAFSVSGITLPATLASGNSITFTLVFKPAASGAASGSLSIVTNLHARALTIPLSGNGAASAGLTVSPASANLGSVTVGSSNTVSATLSASGASVVVSSATTTSSEFTVSGISFPLTVAAGQSVPLTVHFSPTSSGAAAGTLSFVSNAVNSPAVESLTGTGTAATQHDVNLSWSSSSSTVSGYNVYRGTLSGGPYGKINSSSDPGTSFSDTSVQANETYYYVVTGVNSAGEESAYSNQVTAVVP